MEWLNPMAAEGNIYVLSQDPYCCPVVSLSNYHLLQVLPESTDAE